MLGQTYEGDPLAGCILLAERDIESEHALGCICFKNIVYLCFQCYIVKLSNLICFETLLPDVLSINACCKLFGNLEI